MNPLFNYRSTDSNGALNFYIRGSGGITRAAQGGNGKFGWSMGNDNIPYIEFAGSAVPSTARRYQGFAFTEDGAMYATVAAPTSSSIMIDGVAVRADGALHIASSGSTIARRGNGVAITSTGQVVVSDSFLLPLLDAGSGAVNTAAAAASPTPTFTRATVAWTKLSTGLWTQVASGTARSCYTGADTAVGSYGGYFAEAPGIQLVTPDASIRDMTDASWVKGATMTAAKTGTGIDGVVNSCSRLTGGAVSATNTAFQTLTAAASSRTYSVWLRRVTGTGTINITQDGGSTYTDVTSQLTTANFVRVSLTASVLNAAFGIQIVTSGDVVLADFNQFEAGSIATSPMATAGAARNLDELTYTFSGNASASVGTAYAELYTFWTTDPSSGGDGGLAVTFGSAVGPLRVNIGAAATTTLTYDGTTALQKAGLTSMATGVRKRAAAWGGSTQTITGDGVTVTSGAFDGAMTSSIIAIGCRSAASVSGPWNGTIKNVRIWTTQSSNERLQILTT